ncbi:Beta-hexosaminidase 1-like protein [Drosera capensis]
MFTFSSNPSPKPALFSLIFLLSFLSTSFSSLDSSLTYVWPLPSYHTSGADTFTVDPYLSLSFAGVSEIVTEAFERYRSIIFKHVPKVSGLRRYLTGMLLEYDISVVEIVVDKDEDELKLGADESYTLVVEKKGAGSIVGAARIKATTVYGALRGLETFSQLCVFDFGSKSIQIPKAPWNIQDEPRFMYRGLLIDTSRHYIPVDVLKHIIESMSYAKLNVFHWHIIDEESFPLEVPTYPYLWEGAYSQWERYTVEDAKDIVK